VVKQEVDNFNRRLCRAGLLSCLKSALHCMQLINSGRVGSTGKIMTKPQLGKYIGFGRYISKYGLSNYNFNKLRSRKCKFTNRYQFATSVLQTLFSVGYRVLVSKFNNRNIRERVLQSMSTLMGSRQIRYKSINSSCSLKSEGSSATHSLTASSSFKPFNIYKEERLRTQVKMLKFKLRSHYFDKFDLSKAYLASTAYPIKKSLSLLTYTFLKWVKVFKSALLMMNKQCNWTQVFGEVLQSCCGSALLITIRNKELLTAGSRDGKRSLIDELTLIARMFNLKLLPSRP
jgi:hypothetical protein